VIEIFAELSDLTGGKMHAFISSTQSKIPAKSKSELHKGNGDTDIVATT
jgi:hypothetical protein